MRIGPSTGLNPRQLVAVQGAWTDVDIYIDAPIAWLNVFCELRVTAGNLLLPLDSRLVTDLDGPSLEDATRIRGVLFQSRGRLPGEQLEVWATPPNAEDLGEAMFSMICWGQESNLPNDGTGQTIVAPHARRDKVRSFGAVLLAATTTVIAAVPNRRIYVTGFGVTTDDAVPQLVSLQTVDPAGTVTVHKQYVASDQYSIARTYAPPIRSGRGDRWEVVTAVFDPAQQTAVDVQGFVEG